MVIDFIRVIKELFKNKSISNLTVISTSFVQEGKTSELRGDLPYIMLNFMDEILNCFQSCFSRKTASHWSVKDLRQRWFEIKESFSFDFHFYIS